MSSKKFTNTIAVWRGSSQLASCTHPEPEMPASIDPILWKYKRALIRWNSHFRLGASAVHSSKQLTKMKCAIVFSALFVGLALAHPAPSCGGGCYIGGGSCDGGCGSSGSTIQVVKQPAVVYTGGYKQGSSCGDVVYGGGASCGSSSCGSCNGGISYDSGCTGGYGGGYGADVVYAHGGSYGHGNSYGNGGAYVSYGGDYGSSCSAPCATCSAPCTTCKTKNVVTVQKTLVPRYNIVNRPYTECTTTQTCTKPCCNPAPVC